jgi:glycosyltransferase involved in cell wall biosynthesis
VADDLALVRGGIRTHTDVIYQRHARFSLCGAALARVTRRPLFLEYNASEVFTGKYWNKTPLARQLARCERAVLSTASRIFVVSEVGRRELIARGIPSERIVLNPNGVSPDRFANGGGTAVRRAVGLSSEDLVVGFVGTFGPWHGAPLLARAFARLYPDLPRLRMLFVGDGPELEQTREQIRISGGEGVARFVGRVRRSHLRFRCRMGSSSSGPRPSFSNTWPQERASSQADSVRSAKCSSMAEPRFWSSLVMNRG